jgi:4-hydroxy-tetrahydrodipicolinate reductase
LIRAAIIGASGRMGRELLRAAAVTAELTVTGALARPGSPCLGADAGRMAGSAALGVPLTADLPAALEQADVAIDFSVAAATAASVAACRAAGKALLLGTTGHAPGVDTLLDEAACDIPLLVAANTSLGIALLTELVRLAARALPESFDIEIIEAHHRAKRDAPSGTARALARAAAEGRGVTAPEASPELSRQGPRPGGAIGFAVVRAGDIAGEHTVLLAGDGEQLSLSHRVSDRRVFALGAVKAALWLVGQPPGRYGMQDLIELKQ